MGARHKHSPGSAGRPGKGWCMQRPERLLSPPAPRPQCADYLLAPCRERGYKGCACRSGTGRDRVRGYGAGKQGAHHA